MTHRRLLGTRDVEREYGIGRTRQWQLRRSGDLPYRQLAGSRRVYYLEADVLELLEASRKGGRAA